MRLPTVRVRNPAAPDSYMTINESDLADHHELWPEQADPAEVFPLAPASSSDEAAVALRCMGKLVANRRGLPFAEWLALPPAERLASLQEAEREIDEASARRPLQVAKGPGGRWFVMRGGERVSAGFASEEEARAEASRMDGSAPE